MTAFERLRRERELADLILDAGAWVDGLPRFTQAAYDRWIELQTMRRAALANALDRKDTP